MKWYHRLDLQLTLMFVGVLSIVVSLTGWLHTSGTIINLVGPFHEYHAKLKRVEPLLRAFEQRNRPDPFEVLLAEMKAGTPGDLFMVVDDQFNIYAHTTPDNSLIELVRKEADPDFYAVVTSSIARKLDYILLYRKVPYLGFQLQGKAYNLIIIPEPWIVDRPSMTPILFDGLRNHFHIYGWLYGGVVVFFVVFIRWRLRPLRSLEGAAHRLTLREIPDPIEVKVQSDEVGQLVLAFNTALARLNENERLRRRMVSDIAHELRTPLTVLSGRIEAYQDRLIDDADRLIGFTATHLERLSRIVDDLALLTSSDAGELVLSPERLPLRATLERLLESACAGQSYQWRVTGEDLPVILDPHRFAQIILNLVTNALRAKPRGLQIAVTIRKEGDHARIRFEDNGPGVSTEDLPFLFDRLFRPDAGRSQAKGGSGLGLSIVNSLVTAQGGEIHCYQVPGGGLGFAISFPTPSTEA